ncbi:MAG TPA: hypothetical protein VJA26_08635, partial [Gammaproteobacteria bacterium]|nr:hypothetical protein [Gammaproteobacteria bacterium]
LIGNTGGDRLIDWVGEFNSYVVPFAPFGSATVSRTLQPQLSEFLYALSKSDGADQTLGSVGDPRNGEPWAELGLVRQQDFAWQDQTGAPADPQAGNVPGGKRDVLRSADLNNGQLQGFAVDSGTFEVSGGALQVASTSAKSDAVAVYQIGDALPSYYEVMAAVKVIKPTAGWDANSYIVFDYQSATNFKFAGIDAATNKLVIGERTAAGWQVLGQTFFTGSIKSDTWYNMMLSVNGLTATLIVDNKTSLSHVFQPTVVDGYKYGLNWGLVGFGSNKSRGAIDNIAVQVVPPMATVTYKNEFTTGAGTMFDTQSSGSWSAAAGWLSAAPLAGSDTALNLIDLSNVTNLKTASLLELSTTLRTAGRAGFVFDFYSNTDFKFAAIDVASKQVLIGHRTAAGWVIDASASQPTLSATTDYVLGVTVRGSSVSVTLNGQAVTGFVYNAVSVDGRFGLFTKGVGASFDTVTVKTNDAAVPAAQTAAGAAAAVDGAVAVVSNEQLQTLAAEAVRRWASVEDASHLAALGGLEIVLADLPGERLAEFADGRITIDLDASGQGWFVDPTPADDREFSGNGTVLGATPTGDAAGRIDLLSVLAHEIGHAIGFGHSESGVMDDERMPGERALPDAWFRTIGSTVATTNASSRAGSIGPEMGHAIGFGHSESGVMDEDRMPGERALPDGWFGTIASTVATTNASSRAGSIGPEIAGPSVNVAMEAAGRPAVLDSGALHAPGSPLFAGQGPIPETSLESSAPRQAASERSANLGGSFINLGSPLSPSLNPASIVPGSATALRSVAPEIGLSLAESQQRSSSAPASMPNNPIIDWESSRISALDQLNTASSKATSDWLDDFLNHLGQTELQRNPNAAIRVRPASASASAR